MPRRVLEGEVVSDKMDKTVTVLVERRYMHPVYKKFVRTSSKFAAHDENNMFKTGDKVAIEECRPISKRKRWTVITQPGPNAGRPVRESLKAKAKEAEAAELAAKKEKRATQKAEKATARAEAPKDEGAKAKKAPAKKTAAPKKKKDE